MPRTVKEPSVRRNEIIDAAQRFVYTKGYEQMTIQDILDELHISKGAFYHYFDSKGALLEALIGRMAQDAMPIILPIVQDPGLPAMEKLQRIFDTAARWKTDRKDYLLSLLRVWYADENAIVRQKAYADIVKRISPLLSEVIRQGIEEGVLTTPYPDQTGEVFYALLQNLGDAFGLMAISETESYDWSRITRTVAAYKDALERVLGAPPGSLKLINENILKEWFPRWETAPPAVEKAVT